MKTKELPILLTPDGSYFCYRQEIYGTSPAQKEFLQPFLNAFRKGSTNEIVFPDDQKERFVSEALPFIEKIGTVLVDPDLAWKFCRENLVSKIYFDRGAGNGIAVRLEFCYGERVINPFASPGETGNSPASDDTILIRDTEKEKQVLSLLEQSDFIVKQGKIYLDDENKIFEFIMNYLPQLQDLAEIYYSDEFKLKIRTSTSLSGRVRLDENLDLTADDLNEKVLHLPKYRAMYIDYFLRQANLPGLQRNRAFKQLVQSILEPQDGEFEVPPRWSTTGRKKSKNLPRK